MVHKNRNFGMEPQEATLLHAACETYQKAVENYETGTSPAHANMYAEELGRYAGLAFRAAEKLYPWPGATITDELRPITEKHGLNLSYAIWNRGFPDDGTEGCPYTYLYFREEPSKIALHAFCEEAGVLVENVEDQTKDGLFVYSGTADYQRWPELFKGIGW